jgi:hypothetical protein
MDIDIRIENIKRYFSHKIAVDEFILLKLEQHVALIDVDGYQFSMWISNGYGSFDFFGDPFSGVQCIKFDFMNEDQKKLAHRNIMSRAEDYKKTVTKEYLINNIAEMQKELKELENE